MLKLIVFMLISSWLGIIVGFKINAVEIFSILFPMIVGIAFIVGTIKEEKAEVIEALERQKQEIIEYIEKQNEQQGQDS